MCSITMRNDEKSFDNTDVILSEFSRSSRYLRAVFVEPFHHLKVAIVRCPVHSTRSTALEPVVRHQEGWIVSSTKS